MNTTNITLRVSTEIKKELDMYALRDNRSLNNLIETILIKWLEEKGQEQLEEIVKQKKEN